ADQARHGIGAAAGRVWDHQRDGLCRLRRGRGSERGEQEENARQYMFQKSIDHDRLPRLLALVMRPTSFWKRARRARRPLTRSTAGLHAPFHQDIRLALFVAAAVGSLDLAKALRPIERDRIRAALKDPK